MKIRTGNPVRGENFFKRSKLIDKTWDMIEIESDILVAAPRRVGKSSLLFYLSDYPKENYSFIYLNSESVNNENEFFRRLLNKILKTYFVKNSKKVITFLEKNLPNIKKIGLKEIEFGVKTEHNYYDMLIKILSSLNLENFKLIIMLDEFSQTLDNIINDEGERKGIHFLQSNRELRHTTEIKKNIQFLYSGSIGLENLVNKLNAIATINDLSRLEIPPLKMDEAKELINLLIENVTYSLSAKQINYILKRIEWLIPFYIQLTIQEIKNINRDEGLTEVTDEIIDKAFSEMIKQRNHFDHWHTRLRTSFKADEYNFAKELLNILSEKETIESNEIHDLAIKHDLEDDYKNIVGSLVYDGYINNNDDVKIYRYNSPILRMWWWKYVTN
ncbi:MAG: ATP-binding protein [Candidatus Cloacimonetes bacterium]|nr:ATP-binding protein [Candidatus Cloacimonadota bacterium]